MAVSKWTTMGSPQRTQDFSTLTTSTGAFRLSSSPAPLVPGFLSPKLSSLSLSPSGWLRRNCPCKHHLSQQAPLEHKASCPHEVAHLYLSLYSQGAPHGLHMGLDFNRNEPWMLPMGHSISRYLANFCVCNKEMWKFYFTFPKGTSIDVQLFWSLQLLAWEDSCFSHL